MRIFILFVLLSSSALAQPRVTRQLALARICASEEGWDRLTDGCAAIHAVITRGAARSHISYLAFAQAYSPGVFDGSRGRPWLAELDGAGTEPTRWPRFVTRTVRGHVVVQPHPGWRVYRDRWLALYDHAGLIIEGQIWDRCESPPDNWGSPRLRPDRRNAERAIERGRWEVVRCGETRNAFFRNVLPTDEVVTDPLLLTALRTF